MAVADNCNIGKRYDLEEFVGENNMQLFFHRKKLSNVGLNDKMKLYILG